METEILKNKIDKGLDKRLPEASEEPRIIHRAMRYSVFSGGKRIRPIIVIEACKACGGKNHDALAAACAIELIHAYSLIHDDLPSMDDDDFRRGKPSCHKKFGEANAILAGDALLTLAFDILAEGLEPGIAVMAIKELSAAAGTKGMVGGQALDIAKYKNRAIINRLKTAKLFEAAAVMGALSAKADKREIGAARRYGINLGMAFQAIDDIIDEDGLIIGPGRDKARRGAEIAVRKAECAISIFGKKAYGLKKIAELVLSRR